MAVMGGARRALLCCRSSATSHFAGSARSIPPSSVPAAARLSRGKLPSRISRLPVELACSQSLMPFHSATASALLTSMLASKLGSWAWLSEAMCVQEQPNLRPRVADVVTALAYLASQTYSPETQPLRNGSRGSTPGTPRTRRDTEGKMI